MKSLKSFPRNLAIARRERRITQEHLGKLMGTTSMHISHFECGRRAPSLKNMIKISEALKVSIDSLLKQ